MTVLAIGIVAVLVLWTSVLLIFSRPLMARWREPVLACPVLIFESDDWGAGPLTQAEALGRIATVLRSFHDKAGRHPVMTLGIVLEVPDTRQMSQEGVISYHGRDLEDACFSELRQVIRMGMIEGIFAPQLHGLCHYWPAALIEAASCDEHVKAWLTGPEFPETERLPSHLQSRWVDASHLPSTPLTPGQIQNAVQEEAGKYQRLFSMQPHVAVATTFVWTEEVERAWAKHGVEVIVTPGRRATCRDDTGQPGCVDKWMLTGEQSNSGQTYLVRDVYFEPALDHVSQRLLDGLASRTRQGRACLTEIHRFNFMQSLETNLDVLKSAITICLDSFPDVRFMTPLELAKAVRGEDEGLIEKAFRKRLIAWLARLPEIPRFYRVARLTGLIVPIRLAEQLA